MVVCHSSDSLSLYRSEINPVRHEVRDKTVAVQIAFRASTVLDEHDITWNHPLLEDKVNQVEKQGVKTNSCFPYVLKGMGSQRKNRFTSNIVMFGPAELNVDLCLVLLVPLSEIMTSECRGKTSCRCFWSTWHANTLKAARKLSCVCILWQVWTNVQCQTNGMHACACEKPYHSYNPLPKAVFLTKDLADFSASFLLNCLWGNFPQCL